MSEMETKSETLAEKADEYFLELYEKINDRYRDENLPNDLSGLSAAGFIASLPLEFDLLYFSAPLAGVKLAHYLKNHNAYKHREPNSFEKQTNGLFNTFLAGGMTLSGVAMTSYGAATNDAELIRSGSGLTAAGMGVAAHFASNYLTRAQNKTYRD